MKLIPWLERISRLFAAGQSVLLAARKTVVKLEDCDELWDRADIAVAIWYVGPAEKLSVNTCLKNLVAH